MPSRRILVKIYETVLMDGLLYIEVRGTELTNIGGTLYKVYYQKEK